MWCFFLHSLVYLLTNYFFVLLWNNSHVCAHENQYNFLLLYIHANIPIPDIYCHFRLKKILTINIFKIFIIIKKKDLIDLDLVSKVSLLGYLKILNIQARNFLLLDQHRQSRLDRHQLDQTRSALAGLAKIYISQARLDRHWPLLVGCWF